MAYLILNDDIDYTSTWYPTHIIGKNNELLPIFIGASSVINDRVVGLYVKEENYKLIRHDKAYVFIHDPDVTKDDIEEIDWNKIEDVKDNRSANRKHIHIWKEMEYGGSA